jgi:hypothetical protein
VGTCLAQKNFVFLSVGGLIFGFLYRHDFLYISSARQRFGHGNTKILFFTKMNIFAYIVDRRNLHRGTTWFPGGAKTGAVYGINRGPVLTDVYM